MGKVFATDHFVAAISYLCMKIDRRKKKLWLMHVQIACRRMRGSAGVLVVCDD